MSTARDAARFTLLPAASNCPVLRTKLACNNGATVAGADSCPGQNTWKCPNHPVCIPKFYKCDGNHKDCPDGADEEAALCFLTTTATTTIIDDLGGSGGSGDSSGSASNADLNESGDGEGTVGDDIGANITTHLASSTTSSTVTSTETTSTASKPRFQPNQCKYQIATNAPACPDGEWQCPNDGECIKLKYVCDDYVPADCSAGEDEDPDFCKAWSATESTSSTTSSSSLTSENSDSTCTKKGDIGQWQCPQSDKSINCEYVCDDYEPADCDNGEDEDPDFCVGWKASGDGGGDGNNTDDSSTNDTVGPNDDVLGVGDDMPGANQDDNNVGIGDGGGNDDTEDIVDEGCIKAGDSGKWVCISGDQRIDCNKVCDANVECDDGSDEDAPLCESWDTDTSTASSTTTTSTTIQKMTCEWSDNACDGTPFPRAAEIALVDVCTLGASDQACHISGTRVFLGSVVLPNDAADSTSITVKLAVVDADNTLHSVRLEVDTKTTSTTTETTTTVPDPVCADAPFFSGLPWHDKGDRSYNCDWYGKSARRRCPYADKVEGSNEGMSAKDACCACGGGIKFGIGFERDCADKVDEYDAEWHDAINTDHTCAAYSGCEAEGCVKRRLHARRDSWQNCARSMSVELLCMSRYDIELNNYNELNDDKFDKFDKHQYDNHTFYNHHYYNHVNNLDDYDKLNDINILVRRFDDVRNFYTNANLNYDHDANNRRDRPHRVLHIRDFVSSTLRTTTQTTSATTSETSTQTSTATSTATTTPTLELIISGSTSAADQEMANTLSIAMAVAGCMLVLLAFVLAWRTFNPKKLAPPEHIHIQSSELDEQLSQTYV
eukprot:gene1258-28483_t